VGGDYETRDALEEYGLGGEFGELQLPFPNEETLAQAGRISSTFSQYSQQRPYP